MSRLTPAGPVLALVYSDSRVVQRSLDCVVDHLSGSGCRLAGFVQREKPNPGRSRCDMLLHDLAEGAPIEISEDRGVDARGCRLDVGALTSALVRGEQALAANPDLVILNKFGKTEAEGGGFRPLIAAAVDQDVPVLIGVPYANLDPWRAFVGPLGIEFQIEALPTDPAGLCAALGLVISTPPIQPTPTEVYAQ